MHSTLHVHGEVDVPTSDDSRSPFDPPTLPPFRLRNGTGGTQVAAQLSPEGEQPELVLGTEDFEVPEPAEQPLAGGIVELAPPLDAQLEDPQALAQRLAAEAAARLTAPRAEEAEALAQRLAAEAAARLRPATPPPPAEDPVALAQRLATEARARLTPAPAPINPGPKKKKSLADRAARGPKSASEVIQEFPAEPARKRKAAAEAPDPEAPAAAPPKAAALPPQPAPPAPVPVPVAAIASEPPKTRALPPNTDVHAPAGSAPPVKHAPAPVASAPAPVAAAPAPPPTPKAEPTVVIQRSLPGALLEQTLVITRRDVALAIQQAHHARAVRTADLPAIALCAALRDALRGTATLCACRLRWRDYVLVAFLDLDNDRLLGLHEQPEEWMAGLA